MVTSSRVEIEKFNGKVFELWKLKMEDLLVDKEQCMLVYSCTKLATMSKEYWDKLDIKARSTVYLCLLDSILLYFSREEPTKKLWEKLGNMYQLKSLVNKLFSWKKLYHLRMEDGDFVTYHLNAFNTLITVSAFVSHATISVTVAQWSIPFSNWEAATWFGCCHTNVTNSKSQLFDT